MDSQYFPEEVFISSKWGYLYRNWKIDAVQHEVKSHNLARYAGSGSSGTWGTTIVPIHSATPKGKFDNRDVLDELARLKSDGG